MISVLETAKVENQFSRALESVKDAIPPALLINGHNPLTLLYSALSGGLHGKSDEECLELAHAVRVGAMRHAVWVARKNSQLRREDAKTPLVISRHISTIGHP